MLKFTLKREVFESEEKFNFTRQLVKDGVITIEDVRLYVKSEIAYFFNDMISYFNVINRTKYGNSIVLSYKEVRNFMSRYYRQKNAYVLLNICKSNNLIENCGMGYLIEPAKIEFSEYESAKIDDLLFNKGL